MNLLNIKNLFKSYWRELGLICLVAICVSQCKTNCELDQELYSTEKEKIKHELNAQHYVELNNSLKLDIPKYKDSIYKLKEINKRNQKQIVNLHKETKLKLEKVRDYTSKEVKQYFEDRYRGIEISLEAQGVVLKDSVSHLVITDLIKGDSSTEELKITNKMLSNEIGQSTQKDLIIYNQEKQIKNYDSIVSEKDKINILNEKTVKDTKDALHKEQNKKSIWKYIAIGTTIISGTLILNK